MQIILIWFESSLSAHLHTNLKHTAFCSQGKPQIRHVPVWQKAVWQSTDWFCALHIPFPLCIRVLVIFLLNDFFLSAILWKGTLYTRGISKLLVSHSGSIRSMNYITVLHMESLLHKQTHLACMSIRRVQMETNYSVSYLTLSLLAFSQSADRPGLNLYLSTVLS